MGTTIVALCGRIAAGKSSLARELEKLGWRHISTSAHLRRVAGRDADRAVLLACGEALDSSGDWLAELVFGDFHKDARPVVIDAVRSAKQLAELVRATGKNGAHLTFVAVRASDDTIAERMRSRGEDPSAAQGVDLSPLADLVIDTDRVSSTDAAVAINSGRRATSGGDVAVVIGGQYGSEGKGHIAAHVADEYDVLVRSGGPNAGHRVWEETGHYCFHHLPSGTRKNRNAVVVLAAGAALYLPKFMSEMTECDAWGRVLIDRNALVIEEADREFEQQLVAGVGSTAQGVGSAASRRILRTAASPAVRTVVDIPELARYAVDAAEVVGAARSYGKRVMLEGTQGSGLSMFHGPYPHTTSRDTNVGGLLAEVGVAAGDVGRVFMVCRSFPIRVHGNSGPMRDEVEWEDVSATAGVPADELREIERTSTTKRLRRVARFDWSLFARACMLNAPTDIALTFADYIDERNAQATRFDELTAETRDFVALVEHAASARVSLISRGSGKDSIIDRRQRVSP